MLMPNIASVSFSNVSIDQHTNKAARSMIYSLIWIYIFYFLVKVY